MPRLLLIEDEIGAIAALKRMLARAGHEVLVATNLPDALSVIEHERPDALLVGAGLQGESAASLVEAIRAVDLTRPLIVMGDGLGCGEPFLSKPVEPARLIELLHELVPGAPAPAMTTLPDPAPATAPLPEPILSPAAARVEPVIERPVQLSAAVSGPPPSDLARRRELVTKTLAEAQARRQAAEAARALAPKPPPPRSAIAPPRPIVAPPPSVPLDHEPPPRRALDAELFGDLSRGAIPRPKEELPFFQAAHERFPAASVIPPNRPPPPFPERRIETPPEPRSEPTVEAPSLDARFPPERRPPVRHVAPMETLEVPPSGTLEGVEPAALLLACQRARLYGQLKLDQGMVQRILFFDDGRLAGAASSSPDERLEALSYRRGLISREQQRLLRSESQIPTRRLALLMVERAYLKPAELFPLVQERVEEVIYEACGSFSGNYQILTEPVPEDERVALSRSPLALVTEGIRRKYLMERLLAGLGGPATLLRPVRGPELADYGLTARERRLAQSIDGLRNIEELLFESGNEPLPGLKILYALLLGRSVEVAMRGLQNQASSEVEAKIDLTRVAEKYEQVRSANYFEVLGVSSSATAYEIEQSYDRLAREFQPGRFRDLRNPELPSQLDEIQRLLAEARDILVDEGLREEYRAHLRR